MDFSISDSLRLSRSCADTPEPATTPWASLSYKPSNNPGNSGNGFDVRLGFDIFYYLAVQ
jgi:hypothetical protein